MRKHLQHGMGDFLQAGKNLGLDFVKELELGILGPEC
jgi:hypothetical protein